MSWEALRLTSRTPSEVYGVLGPHGVEELLREARNVCWREQGGENRSVAIARKALIDVFERNMKVWAGIKKPSPEAFFTNLAPHAADGHIRQALVLTWMMMPRAGGRSFVDVAKIVRHLFDRTLANWEEEDAIFTKGWGKKAKPKVIRAKPAKPKPKKSARKK
jgi:hypothetical protein